MKSSKEKTPLLFRYIYIFGQYFLNIVGRLLQEQMMKYKLIDDGNTNT
ncbi:hypothetical protein HanXRQr2_Chr10g0447261 [Helianthus annuus]|uniref:Uncharacterized protein n=1 Tax=Helianthus annuus TaxID=4232 RepID=A0A9K3N4Q2_HELAN|nr:hypothetical protein HanXRQr2_Chr10g0447261 [Helianthus annuus]KAJ0522393.1 hypothetical protein HanIR_Chr10g0482141 [Helianthus annuus]